MGGDELGKHTFGFGRSRREDGRRFKSRARWRGGERILMFSTLIAFSTIITEAAAVTPSAFTQLLPATQLVAASPLPTNPLQSIPLAQPVQPVQAPGPGLFTTPIVTSPIIGTAVAAPETKPSPRLPEPKLSETSEHLLIAAASIGIAAIIGFVMFLLYRRYRNKGRQAFRLPGTKRVLQRQSPKGPYDVSAPLGNDWGHPEGRGFVWEKNKAWEPAPYDRLPDRPIAAAVHSPSGSLSKPSFSSSNSNQQRSPSPRPYPPLNPTPTQETEKLPFNTEPSAPRTVSMAASSPVLPIEIPSPYTTSPLSTPRNQLQPQLQPQSYQAFTPGTAAPMPPLETTLLRSPLGPPAPPFAQPAGNNSPHSPSFPKTSRFSWTNSQAPKTPLDTRFSVATSVSSIPRYRTVESWVGFQANRLDEQRFQEYLRQQIEAAVSEPVPDVPLEFRDRSGSLPTVTTTAPAPVNIPRPPSVPPTPTVLRPAARLSKSVPKFQALRRPPNTTASQQSKAPLDMINTAAGAAKLMPPPKRKVNTTTPLPPPPALPPPPPEEVMLWRKGSSRRNSTMTSVSDSPVFRQHPGTEVPLPRMGRIPSEILDIRIGTADSL